MLKKLQLQWKTRLYLLIFVICLISLYAGLADYDWYWQCELGRAVIKDFNFNAVYDLAWGTDGISEYLDHEWLTNVLFYLCSVTGKYGISVAKLLICLAYAWGTCFYLENEDRLYSDAAVTGICAYLFIMSTVFIKVKAYILSVVFLFVEIVFLKRYKASRDKQYFIYMFILLVLWNNMHSGSVPLFFLVAGVYWLTELKRSKQVLVMLPVYGFGLCINPYGYKLVLFDFMHNFDPVMKEIIADWRCIDGKEPLGVICTLLVIGVGFYLIGTDAKSHAFDLIMIGVVFYLSFQSARHLIYLAPFFYSVVLDNKYSFKLGDTIRGYIAWFCVGIAVLSLVQGFSSPNYDKTYAMNYMEPELVEVLRETNKETSDGLYASSWGTQVWTIDLKAFSFGAFPCVRERALADYELTYSASEARISELINKWGLTKFLAVKGNPAVSFSSGNGVLFDYLFDNDEYELLYDSDFYYYFVRKDLLA